jgi:nucleoside-diphosphate-sugar epimerase
MKASRKTLLLTGVTGFAGRYLAKYFIERGYKVVGAARNDPQISDLQFFKISNLDRYTHWQPILTEVDAVVHLAGRAHHMREKPGSDHLYFETNVDGTINLATQAAEAGVSRLVFVSSVKAIGEGGENCLFTESTVCEPVDPYGRSKFKAEIELKKIAGSSGLSVVSLRPPLMYGLGVKGNFASLIRLVKAMPILPLAGLNNRRSFIAIRNFASAVEAVLNSETVNCGSYLVSDGEAISTSELINRIISVFSPRTRNIAMPSLVWNLLAKIPCFSSRILRLTESLEVDSSAFCRELEWTPPFSMLDQLKEMK